MAVPEPVVPLSDRLLLDQNALGELRYKFLK
jgi:hypothetical protein